MPSILDYQLFRSLSNSLRGSSFNNNGELQNWFRDRFTSNHVFSKQEGEKLPERSEKVIKFPNGVTTVAQDIEEIKILTND